jgi:hypothetical protein
LSYTNNKAERCFNDDIEEKYHLLNTVSVISFISVREDEENEEFYMLARQKHTERLHWLVEIIIKFS